MAKLAKTRLKELVVQQLEITFELEDIINNQYAEEVCPAQLTDAYTKASEALERLRSAREVIARDENPS